MAEIRCPLHESAQISRDEPALRWAGDAMVYYELDQYVSGTAQRLRQAGYSAGDRIGLLPSASWHSIAAFLGILRLGAVACPLNPRLPQRAVQACLEQVGAAGLISDTERAGGPVVPFHEVVKMPDPRLPVAKIQNPQLDQDATIVFTSGTSGRPKAVLHTYGNHYYSALGSNRNIRIRSKESWLLSVPLYHVSGIGILFRCVVSGATVALPGATQDLIDVLHDLNPTYASLVPTQLYRLLKEGEAFEGIKALLVGGGPVPFEWVEQAARLQLPVVLSYGLTEMASQVTTDPIAMPSPRKGTAGTLLRHRELKLSEDGEICVRGRTLFKGYVDGTEIGPSLNGEGWFVTGDYGELDSEGFLTVLGRKDLMFISGGENIYPEEVEAAINALPGVEGSVVVPVSSEEFGQRPVAFVRVEMDGPSREALTRELAQTLPRFKVPDAFLPWPENEDNGLKVDRRRFAEIAATLHE